MVKITLERVITPFVHKITCQNQQLQRDITIRARNAELHLKRWKI
jgi:hypothetical protein